MRRSILLLLVAAVAGCSVATEPEESADSNLAASTTCGPPPTCSALSTPTLGEPRAWRRSRSNLIAIPGADHHRGRDLIVKAGQEQWVIGKIAYGLTDKDLKGEEVDIFVERDCKGAWEKLGTTVTTQEGEHATVEGVDDSGGRVYFPIPADKLLPTGRHRVRLVVAGDHTYADLFIDVVNDDTPVFVSDVDGTLTSSEFVEFKMMLKGELPKAQPDAAKVFSTLSEKGYRAVYLTARPEWLTKRTRQFFAEHGFPPGIVHTTTTVTGALGTAAADFKMKELQLLTAKGLDIRWAFGNKPSDTEAYRTAGFGKHVRCIFLRLFDPYGGRRIEGYTELLPDVSADQPVCSPER